MLSNLSCGNIACFGNKEGNYLDEKAVASDWHSKNQRQLTVDS
jgi:hypothetical protein